MYWEKVDDYHVEIRAGFTPLRSGAYSTTAGEPIVDFRIAPTELRIVLAVGALALIVSPVVTPFGLFEIRLSSGVS